MSEIQRLPSVPNPNPVHPNAKSTSQINNGTTTSKTNITSPICRNCKTQTTPLWRRDETGQVLCNACGLFLKLHGRPRPISLKTDTIKSRNRIKHPNFTKFSGPNTPELKSKDPKSSHEAVAHHLAPKTSPIPNTAKKSSPHDSPSDLLLSMGGYSSTTNTTPNVTTAVQSPLSHPSRAHYSGAVYNSQIQGQYSNLPPQVQSLHYPSSTPTQFAPGLQRITSPLLLSTTPSVSNARFSNSASSKLSPQNPLTAVQAAGALENMSNELGPSATFKGSASTPGSYSLMNSSKRSETSLSTPSSALKSAPTLPALGDTKKEPNVYASPSFGPQFHLQDGAHSNSPNGGNSGKTTPGPGGACDGPKVDLPKLEAGDHPKPSLPPLNNSGVSLATQLPQLSVGSGHSSPAPGAKEHVKSDGYMHSYDSQVSAHNSSHTGPQKQKRGPVGSHNQSVAGTHNQSVAGAQNHGHPQAHTQNDQKQSLSGSHSNSHQNSNHGQSQTHTQSHTSNVNSTSNHGSSYMQGRSNQASNFSHSGNNNDEQDNNNKKNNGHESTPSSGQSYEVSALKTRISELELVNDLYRTRIMELEAMEQAARIRENSMRKRLDDLISESTASKREGDHGEESAKRPKPN